VLHTLEEEQPDAWAHSVSDLPEKSKRLRRGPRARPSALQRRDEPVHWAPLRYDLWCHLAPSPLEAI
jgi:hypothetical protein